MDIFSMLGTVPRGVSCASLSKEIILNSLNFSMLFGAIWKPHLSLIICLPRRFLKLSKSSKSIRAILSSKVITKSSVNSSIVIATICFSAERAVSMRYFVILLSSGLEIDRKWLGIPEVTRFILLIISIGIANHN